MTEAVKDLMKTSCTGRWSLSAVKTTSSYIFLYRDLKITLKSALNKGIQFDAKNEK
jgi:hypothetical protein